MQPTSQRSKSVGSPGQPVAGLGCASRQARPKPCWRRRRQLCRRPPKRRKIERNRIRPKSRKIRRNRPIDSIGYERPDLRKISLSASVFWRANARTFLHDRANPTRHQSLRRKQPWHSRILSEKRTANEPTPIAQCWTDIHDILTSGGGEIRARCCNSYT